MRSLSAVFTSVFVLLAGIAGAVAVTNQQDAPQPLPAGSVARIDSSLISKAEYLDFLFERSGQKPLDDLIYLHLLHDEAKRLKCELAAGALDQEWQAEQTKLLARNDNDAERLQLELEQMGFGRGAYKRRFLLDARAKLLEENIVLATRTLAEDDIVGRFNNQYGEDGRRVTVRHIMLTRARMQQDLIAQRVRRSEITLDRLDLEIDQKAASVLSELEGGADFEALARRESADLSVVQNGGVIPNYNYRHYGPLFAEAVRAAKIGQAVGPLKTQAAVHIFLVEERVVTTLAEVRTEIEKHLMQAKPQFIERATLRKRLHAEHTVQLGN